VRPARLTALRVPGDAQPWRDLGFTVVDDAVPLANGAIRVGAVRASLEVGGREPTRATVDGIPVGTGEHVTPVGHRNGAVELDHVVIMTDSLQRTSESVLESLGLEQRRVRETPSVRQAFHRFADDDGEPAARGCIVEVVEGSEVGEVSLWGVVVIVDDLDAAVESAGGLVGAPRDAVQSGRRIATVSRVAGLPLAVALMSR
jgi:hypothetical protein